jgi:hypothetical protein
MNKEQELRAWSLAISAILHKGNPDDFEKLVKSAGLISRYIENGTIPPKKDYSSFYPK